MWGGVEGGGGGGGWSQMELKQGWGAGLTRAGKRVGCSSCRRKRVKMGVSSNCTSRSTYSQPHTLRICTT